MLSSQFGEWRTVHSNALHYGYQFWNFHLYCCYPESYPLLLCAMLGKLDLKSQPAHSTSCHCSSGGHSSAATAPLLLAWHLRYIQLHHILKASEVLFSKLRS